VAADRDLAEVACAVSEGWSGGIGYLTPLLPSTRAGRHPARPAHPPAQVWPPPALPPLPCLPVI